MADFADYKTSRYLPYSFDFTSSGGDYSTSLPAENPYTLGGGSSSYTASATTTTAGTSKPSADKSSTTDDVPTYVNPSLLYTRIAIGGGLDILKSVRRASGQPMISVMLPDIKGLDGYSTIDYLSDTQRNSHAGWLLAENAFDLIVNDAILDNLAIPDNSCGDDGDDTCTNEDLDPNNNFGMPLLDFLTKYDPTTGTTPIPDQLTFGTAVFMADLLDEGFAPTRDLYNVQIMIDNNPKSTAARVGNLSYFSLLPVVNTPGFNRSAFALSDIQIDQASMQVQIFQSQTGGALNGISKEEAAMLISYYQDSGDALTHIAVLAYFQEHYGIDLEAEGDPTTALVIGAAKNAAHVSPSSALASLFMASKALALGQQFSLNTTASAGAQFTLREMMNSEPWVEDLASAGLGLGTGALQLGSAGLFSGYKLQPITYVATASEQLGGFAAAKIAKGDEELLLATVEGLSQIGGAIPIPYSLAALSYSTDYEYIINEDGSNSPNPTTFGFYWGVYGLTNFSDIWTSRKAGKYLWKAQQTKDPRYAAPAIAQGAGVLLSEGMYVYYASKHPLPETFDKYYADLQEEYDFEDPFTGNNEKGMLTIPAVTTAVLNGGFMLEGYLEAKGHTKNHPEEVQLELEAAGKEYVALVDAGADPVLIQAAQDRFFRAQEMAKTQEALAQGTLSPEQIELDSAQNNYETLVKSGAARENIEIAADRVEAARKAVAASETKNDIAVFTNSGTQVSVQATYTMPPADGLMTKTPTQIYREAQAKTTLAVDHYNSVVAENASEAEIMSAQKQVDAAMTSEAEALKAMGKPDLITWADKHVRLTTGPEKANLGGLGINVAF